jgi:uncharacterized protein YjbI with pentapeptide repeats
MSSALSTTACGRRVWAALAPCSPSAISRACPAGPQSLRRRLHRRADGRLRPAPDQARQRQPVRRRYAGRGPDRRVDAPRRPARLQPARRQPDRRRHVRADLREGTIAAADRKEGYRVIEAVQRDAYAKGANLSGANLERSRLSGIVATKADFSDAILKDAKLVRANLKQANFNGANLAGADLSGANLAGADLRNTILVGAKTMSWNVNDTNMEGALTDKPSGTSVSDLPYEQMIADHARWIETGGAEGKPSVFDKADLRNLRSVRGFNLTALSAKGAVFYGLDMEGVQMQGAQLEGADLRACNLRRADLRGARLKGAKLTGSDLRDAQLGPLLIAADRVLPVDLTGAILANADLARADLRQARMTGADVSRANFTGANLKDIDLTGAIRLAARGLDDVI